MTLDEQFAEASRARALSWDNYMGAVKKYGIASPEAEKAKAANRMATNAMRAAEQTLSGDFRTPDEKLFGAIFGPAHGDKK